MTTIERVKVILARVSGLRDIGDDAELAATPRHGGLGLDSLDRLDVAMQLEEEFGLEIPDDDVDRAEMGTPAGIAAYLDRRLSGPTLRTEGISRDIA